MIPLLFFIIVISFFFFGACGISLCDLRVRLTIWDVICKCNDLQRWG
jgi:hypothetical protein